MLSCSHRAQYHGVGSGEDFSVSLQIRSLHRLSSCDSSGPRMGCRAPSFPHLGLPLSSHEFMVGASWCPFPKQILFWTLYPQGSPNNVNLSVTSICESRKYFSPPSPPPEQWVPMGFKGPKRGQSRNSSKIYSKSVYCLFLDRILPGNF